MAAKYRAASRAAYLFQPDAAPWTANYRALPLPEYWDQSVLDLCNVGLKPGAEPYRAAPVARFNGVLQALAPDLIVRGRPRDQEQRAEDFWLYAPADAPHPLPGDTLDRLTGAWLQDLRPEPNHHRAVLDTLTALRAAPPQWQDVTVDLLGCPPTMGGTASPRDRQYQLATDALARRILALGPYEHSAGSLHFRAVPRGPRQQGAELLSQPLSHVIKGREWWFSIVINVTLHTVPFAPEPRLHLHTGVRRWATHPEARKGRLRLPFGRDTSVYLLPKIPWLPGAPASDRYAVARLAWSRGAQGYAWRNNGPAQMLGRLALSRPFPVPEALLADPMQWIGDGDGTRAAVVHSTHMGAHGIGTGLMSHQRSQITQWAEQALPDGVSRAPSLLRASAGSSTPSNARPKPKAEDKPAEAAREAGARRAALAVAARINDGQGPAEAAKETGESEGSTTFVETRLLWQSPSFREAAIDALTNVLGLEGDGGRPALTPTENPYDLAEPGSPVVLEWRAPELTLRLRCLRTTGGIAETLGIDPKERPKGKALETGISRRRKAVEDFLTADGADPQHPGFALVEIDRRQDFAHRLDDPKYALRLGCADAGVLTQFALVPKKAKGHNSEKDLAHRVHSGWQDALRQFGVRVLPEHTLGDALPDGLRYVATYMVKRRKDGPTRLPRHTPVSVMVTPLAPGSGLAAVTGWDEGTRRWVSYPRFLLGLVKTAEIPEVNESVEAEASAPEAVATVPRQRSPYKVWQQDMEEQRRATARYLQKMIRSLRGRPTVLLTHSQNSRKHWPWLQDGLTERDLIKTGHAEPSGLDPDLRLVRVRTATGRETPQWWGNAAPGEVNGLPQGLWVEDEEAIQASSRVFYSTTPKASTFRVSAVEADKIAPRPLRQGPNKGTSTIDTHIPAWNPGMVEIAVLGCHPDDGDSPEALALAVHQLRQAPDYLDALSLPLPLHLASLAQHYVLPTVAESERDDEEALEQVAEPQPKSTSEGQQLVAALGVIAETVDTETADMDPEFTEEPGLAQAPEDEQLTLFP
ncbi:pPIWI_RE module domain-containing protein [Streptomyces sp. NPDC060022]|uniref:pPIWI_RE module domain-containing protein n=1 Tax=Streptomyces sp. NPDC060022 TaxID=3347039 RepID=UPI0036C976ED